MQPNLSNSPSGLPYRKIVKRYFRRIKRFYLSVSVCESVSCDLFLAFLTDGNKSTTTNRRSYFHSTVTRQASSTTRETFCAVIPTPSNFSPSTHAPNHTPRHTPHYMPHHTPAPHTPTPHLPSMSHVIPPGPHSSTARKPQNINDPISNPETSSRELRAKLLRLRSQGPADHTPPSPYQSRT